MFAALQGGKGGVTFSVNPGVPGPGFFTVYFAEATTEIQYLGWLVTQNPVDFTLPG